MPPPAESLITSDQHGLIAIQMAEKHARYRVQLREDGSLTIIPEPQAQPIQFSIPSEIVQVPATATVNHAASASLRAAGESSVLSSMPVPQLPPTLPTVDSPILKPATSPSASASLTRVASARVPAAADSGASAAASASQRTATSNPAPPAAAPAAPASSASDGWLQLNREAMQLLRGRPARSP